MNLGEGFFCFFVVFFLSSPNFGQKNGLNLGEDLLLLVFIILKFSGPYPFENCAYASVYVRGS